MREIQALWILLAWIGIDISNLLLASTMRRSIRILYNIHQLFKISWVFPRRDGRFFFCKTNEKKNTGFPEELVGFVQAWWNKYGTTTGVLDLSSSLNSGELQSCWSLYYPAPVIYINTRNMHMSRWTPLKLNAQMYLQYSTWLIWRKFEAKLSMNGYPE